MKNALRRQGWWWLAGLGLSLAGCGWLAQSEINRLHNDFDVNARIVHRLLSQKVVQYDAVLATLALLGTTGEGNDEHPERRIAAVYPSILKVDRKTVDSVWTDAENAATLSAAAVAARSAGHAMIANPDLANGRYQLVIAAEPTHYALTIDLAETVPWSDWPMDAQRSPVHVQLKLGDAQYTIQPGKAQQGLWQFEASKVLASASQPFDVIARRSVSVGELPWLKMAAWTLSIGLLVWGLNALQRQRMARRRAEELLRLGQVSRLNALGELAAGMAHELNQPLTAILASTQAAQRLLNEDEPDIDTARLALQQSVAQSRRAADVVARLRRAVERPGGGIQAISLQDVVASTLHLLEPEYSKRQVRIELNTPANHPIQVLADPVALEQITHNLIMNALQALESSTVNEGKIQIELLTSAQRGVLRITDNGPGVPPELQSKLFEPFFSTRSKGLGLGLSLCETLATEMNGSLRLITDQSAPSTGARFELELPLSKE